MQAINLTTDMMGEVIMKNQDGLMRIIEIGDAIKTRMPANDWMVDPLFVADPMQPEWR